MIQEIADRDEPSQCADLHRRLIAAALDRFGQQGFDGASTRRIAKSADTAMSALTYHFGGKAELHRAVATRVAERIAARLAPAWRVLDQAEEPTAARLAWGEVMAALLAFVCDSEEELFARFILRGRTLPLEWADDPITQLFDGIVDRLAADASAAEAPPPGCDLLATSVLSQVLLALVVAEHSRRRSARSLDSDLLKLLEARVAASANDGLDALFGCGAGGRHAGAAETATIAERND